MTTPPSNRNRSPKSSDPSLIERRTLLVGTIAGAIGTTTVGSLSRAVAAATPTQGAAPGLQSAQLKDVVRALIDTGAQARARRSVFNKAPEDYLSIQDLTDAEKRVRLYKMDRNEIIAYVNANEGGGLDDLATWKWPDGEWPAKDPDPLCYASTELEKEYPDPSPEVYSLTPGLEAGKRSQFELIGRGLVEGDLSVDFVSGTQVVPAQILRSNGTFRCSRIVGAVSLAADSYKVHVWIGKGRTGEYEVTTPKGDQLEVTVS